MTTPHVDRAFLDTNVLLAATDEARADHRGAIDILNVWPARGTVLYASGQIFREYLVVATRPIDVNGLGLPLEAALGNTAAFATRVDSLPEDERVRRRLEEILRTVGCTGRQIHDANVVATMLAHGVETVVTSNVADFVRFGHLIDVVEPGH